MKRGTRLFLAAGVCVLLAALARFVLVGYGMTALCFLALAAVSAFYGLMRRWHTTAAKALSVLAAIVIAAGLAAVAVFEVPIVRDARSDADTDADYIIVFGAAVHGSTPSLSMTERTDAALAWLEAHPDGIAVVSGGQGGGENMTEAQAMADYLTARGIDPARILLEPKATSSYENLLFSLRVIEADGGDITGRVALCSSEYHMHRLAYMARLLSAEPVRVAAATGRITLRLNYMLREAFAMAKCRLFGLA